MCSVEAVSAYDGVPMCSVEAVSAYVCAVVANFPKDEKLGLRWEVACPRVSAIACLLHWDYIEAAYDFYVDAFILMVIVFSQALHR